MTSQHLKEFADLFGKGFRPYQGEIMPFVYEELGCRDPKKAYWVCKWPILYCFGCRERCTPRTPQGFQLMLPEASAIQANGPFSITPAEMLASKSFLRADEAAYCLSVSPRKVYAMASEGKLITHIDKPFRVTVESVKDEMNRIDL
ncbi:DNA-binding protein [Pseudodesulfovibrio sp.]|uniref:DNA-binding protein n=1 Tax=unclassified Pseudodesulfovibrio TaxID=2661612 RepID=UPI003B0097FA